MLFYNKKESKMVKNASSVLIVHWEYFTEVNMYQQFDVMSRHGI